MSVDRITRKSCEHESKRTPPSTQKKKLHQERQKSLGEMSHGRQEERGRKLRRRSNGSTEMDGEVWLMDEVHTWESLRKEKKGAGEYGG